MGELQTLSVMGLPIHWGTHYEDWLLMRHQQGLGAHVVTLNAEMAMQADQNPELKAVLCQADLAIPDGAGIVLYFRLKGQRLQRCPGIELAESLLQALTPEHSAFFLGAAPGVAETAAQNWRSRKPDLNIVGVQDGYFQTDDLPALEAQLQTLQPTVIFSALQPLEKIFPK